MSTFLFDAPRELEQVYLVGGAVRDKLMGVQSEDRDFVVVGESPEKMKELGFRPVGDDFPVFLHPKSVITARSFPPISNFLVCWGVAFFLGF